MERIIKIILLITIMMASITLFFVLLKVILPKLFLKIEYSVENCLGRGVKKYTYPNGIGYGSRCKWCVENQQYG